MHRMTVLIASADLSNTQILTSRLEESDYSTFFTDSGRHALRVVGTQPINLVIVDWNLPDISALLLIRAIRKVKPPGELPIAVIHASGMNDAERILALEAGADLCLVEIQSREVFLARMRALLRTYISRCEMDSP